MKDKYRKGVSYKKRVQDINRIFEEQTKLGLSNREIWRRHIYPRWGICEREMYRILNAACDPVNEIPHEQLLLFEFEKDE